MDVFILILELIGAAAFAVSGAKQHIVKRSDMIFAVTGLYLQEDIIFAVLIQILAIFIHGDEPPCFHRFKSRS